MRHTRITIFSAALLLLSVTSLVGSEGPSAFTKIGQDYEVVRQALLHDRTTGVAERAGAITSTLRELETDFSARRAGIATERTEDFQPLLPKLTTAAEELAAAETLEQTRQAFYSLSQLLVRYRGMAVGEKPVVAYCPMAKKSWLQPEGEIGNPYYGQQMLRCGEVVER